MTVFIQSRLFKAKCLQIINDVKEKHIRVIITKHGKPIAKLVPVEDASSQILLGCMKDTITIKEDIVSPLEEDWEANE
jgi:prevent-host-death family protein